MKRLQYTFAAVALTVMLISCGKSVSDDSLANDVKAKLYADSATKQANIDVAVKDGNVTLSGNAPTSDAALAAVNDANSVSGIKHVDNQIAVGGQLPNADQNAAAVTPPPAAAPAPANPSERDRRRERDHDRDRDRDQAAESPAPPAATVVPAGTSLSVRTGDTISAANASAGQRFQATLADPIMVNGAAIVPQGAPVTLELVSASQAGRIAGKSQLQLRVASIEYNGQTYDVASSDVTQVGKGRGKQTAVRTGIGAAAGAVIGALAGGGKGAAIGSLAGAGGGLGFQYFTKGKQVDIPAESILTFTLSAPLTLH